MIRVMLAGYNTGNISADTPTAYWMLLTDIPLEIIGKACRSLMEEIPPRKFAPNASELHAKARYLMPKDMGEPVIAVRIGDEPPPGYVFLGQSSALPSLKRI